MNDEKLNIIKSTLNDFFPQCVILLFGSLARGDHNASSDYDLVIIVEEEMDITQKWNYQAQIRKILAKNNLPVDIIIQSDAEYKLNKARSGHIIRYASQEGVLI